MNPLLPILFILCAAIGMAQDNTREFRYGTDFKQKTIYLHTDGQFSTYYFCDVCAGLRTFGSYKTYGDKMVLRDTIQYKYVPYYAAPEDTVVETKRYQDTLFIGTMNGENYLYYDPQTFNKVKETNDKKLLEQLVTGKVFSALAIYKELK